MTSTIIAGRFQEQAEVEEMIEELQRAGFARERISSFYVNPPGRHATFPIGGDRAASPGAQETGKGTAMGAAAGAAVGVAATPFLGPVGAVTGGLVGAHLGGTIGAMSQAKEPGETGEHGEDKENAAPVREAGMMIAVAVSDDHQIDHALRVLRAAGAMDIERAQGTIENGDWVDFDPLATPELVHTGGDMPLRDEHQRRI
jgi:hypothetical protein